MQRHSLSSVRNGSSGIEVGMATSYCQPKGVMDIMRLKINNLYKSYNKVVLDGVNFEFVEGKIYGIVGRNGAGKTTLFNCLNSDVNYEQGSISLISDEGERELQFDDIGLVSASPALPEFLTGYEFIQFFIKLNQEKNSQDNLSVDDYFDLVRIDEEDRFKLIKAYSYGMKNKLQLLCCLIRKPKVIMLDEPLSSFDIIVSHDIKELLIEMKKEHIILMSTHIMQLAQDVSDEIVLLHKGKLSVADKEHLQEEGFEKYIVDFLKDDQYEKI